MHTPLLSALVLCSFGLSQTQNEQAVVCPQVCMTRSDPGAVQLHSIGCTAEVRQIKRQDDGVLNIVAKGRSGLPVVANELVFVQSTYELLPNLGFKHLF